MPKNLGKLVEQNTRLLEQAAQEVCYAIPPEEAEKIAAVNAKLSYRTKEGTPVYTFNPHDRPTVQQLQWMFAGQASNTPLTRALVKVGEQRGMVQAFPPLPTTYRESYPERFFPLPEVKRSPTPKEQVSPTIAASPNYFEKPLIRPGFSSNPAHELTMGQIDTSPDAVAEIEQAIKLKRKSGWGLNNFMTGLRAVVGRVQVDQLFAPVPKSFPPGDPLLVTLLPGALNERSCSIWNRNLSVSARTGLDAMTDFFVFQALSKRPDIIYDQGAAKRFGSAAFTQAQNAQKLALASGDGVVCSSVYERPDLRLSWEEVTFLAYALTHMFDSTALDKSKISQFRQ